MRTSLIFTASMMTDVFLHTVKLADVGLCFSTHFSEILLLPSCQIVGVMTWFAETSQIIWLIFSFGIKDSSIDHNNIYD